MNVAVDLAPVVALVGNPNCGKTALFNALTGSRQKVANYPGVTVEKKTGRCKLPDGRNRIRKIRHHTIAPHTSAPQPYPPRSE